MTNKVLLISENQKVWDLEKWKSWMKWVTKKWCWKKLGESDTDTSIDGGHPSNQIFQSEANFAISSVLPKNDGAKNWTPVHVVYYTHENQTTDVKQKIIKNI